MFRDSSSDPAAANVGTSTSVTTPNLSLSAATGIGTSATPLQTSVSNVAAIVTAGALFLNNSGGLTFTSVGGLATSAAATTLTVTAHGGVTFAQNVTSGGDSSVAG